MITFFKDNEKVLKVNKVKVLRCRFRNIVKCDYLLGESLKEILVEVLGWLHLTRKLVSSTEAPIVKHFSILAWQNPWESS